MGSASHAASLILRQGGGKGERRQRCCAPSRRARRRLVALGCASKWPSFQRLAKSLAPYRPLRVATLVAVTLLTANPEGELVLSVPRRSGRSLANDLSCRFHRCALDGDVVVKGNRLVLAVLLVCALGLTLSCGDSTPTGVAAAPQPQADLIGGLLGGTGLLSCSSLPYDSMTKVIGPAGGSLQVGAPSFFLPPVAPRPHTPTTTVVPTPHHSSTPMP